MLEVLTKIKEAEEEAQKRVVQAQQEASALRSDAQKQGKTYLDQAKLAGHQEAQSLVKEARQKSQAQLEAADARSRQECQQLLELAQSRIERAADLIVERIVSMV